MAADFLFVFRRREHPANAPTAMQAMVPGMGRDITSVAAEKQKEKCGGMVSGYKQVTPTEFGELRRK